jgi:hypothetical protein
MIVRTPCTVATVHSNGNEACCHCCRREIYIDDVKSVKNNIKLSPCVIKHHAVKACGEGVEV